jgi:hypothetical protein
MAQQQTNGTGALELSLDDSKNKEQECSKKVVLIQRSHATSENEILSIIWIISIQSTEWF